MSDQMIQLFITATGETLYMAFLAGLISALVGIPLGVLLYITAPNKFLAHKSLNLALGTIVNVGRSIPFIILVVAIIPFTKLLVGTFIGNTAMIVPLSVSAIPFVARMVEGALSEVPTGLIEAAQSMGATSTQIITKVLLPEAIPGIIHALTVTLIALIGYSAMAGAVGAGGLGKVGIAYGYQRFNPEVMIYTVIILVVLVQAIQMAGDFLARKMNHR